MIQVVPRDPAISCQECGPQAKTGKLEGDAVCTACPAVAHLDLKVILHRGHVVRQAFGSGSDLLGPAVTIAHRLLKNTVRDRIGFRPYLFVTDAAAAALGVSEVGIVHAEEYADAGRIGGRIVELGAPADKGVST